MPKLNFIDVFAGAGGLSCGMEMAGMQCLLGVDHNKHAMATFARNHKKAETYCGDITKLTKKHLLELINNKKIHAVVGGPPCQGFSTVGTGDPGDQRNSLFLQFVRIVKITEPSFVVLENVTGLLAKKNEDTLKAIFKKFARLGYHMDVQVMSSEKYGVPEKRRRTIIIGTKINEKPVFPKQTHDVVLAKTYRPPKTVGEALKNLKTKNGKLHNHDLDLAKVSDKIDEKRLLKIPEGHGIRYERDELEFLPPRLRLGIDWENLRENRFRQTKYYKLDRKKPSPTIMTHRHSYYHPVEPRFLTQREAAALQSFPNNFVFEGPLSAQWRQIGNAVPPLLGKAIGKSLISMFKKGSANLSKNKKRGNVETDIHKIRGKAFVYSEA
ncbi:MAG: DNA cytosine methyltransferase [Bacteriovoracaceae bacterium]|nr:DNA cytosine methyltransferase [Bacteriovoracaceae bacterium]